MPRQIVIHIQTESVEQKATEYFCRICGFNRGGERNQRMMANALDFHRRIRPMLNIQAVFASFDDFGIEGAALAMEGITIDCSVFEQICRESVERIYGYILTVGDIVVDDTSDGSLLDVVYADAWGTAYVDATREQLQATLADDARGCVVTDSFGPGYYGMDTSEMRKLFMLIDGGLIGVTLLEDVFMSPQKSCVGLYFALKRGTALPVAACKYCGGSKCGCLCCDVLGEQ